MTIKQTVGACTSRIAVHGLVKRYRNKKVLDHLALNVGDGDICLLVGDNGSGKTTLLRIIASLVRPDAGKIQVGPYQLPAEAAAVRSRIGLVGHQPMVYGDLTAEENLYHYARLYGLPEPHARVQTVLVQLDLLPFCRQQVRTFSRGMQQRLSIARAILPAPQVLLMDEPYTGLDQSAVQLLDDQLRNWRRPGKAVLITDHYPRRLLSLVTHIAWLHQGQINIHLPVSQMASAPALMQYLQEAG